MTHSLSAGVYDALAASALEFGGIGARRFREEETGNPVCPYGHAWRLDGRLYAGPMNRGLVAAGITIDASERAVRAVNRRLRAADKHARISFADWCAELGVERGL